MVTGYAIPNGPMNLASLFPGVDFSLVQEYYVEVLDAEGTTIATLTRNLFDGECCDDKARLYWVNYSGGVDAMNFMLVPEEHETKSDAYTSPLVYPLVRSKHSGNRMNTHANDIKTLLNNEYTEADKEWIAEMIDSPRAWLEMIVRGDDSPSYIPVVIQDGTFQKIKEENRFIYETKIIVKLSAEKIILRN